MSNIEIIKDKSELEYERWSFYFMDNKILLDTYCVFKKETKKHKSFKCVDFYNRLNERDSSIKESEVPFYDEIKKEALDLFVSKLSVRLWSERSIK